MGFTDRLSGPFLRYFGFGWLCGALALARFTPLWQLNVLCGMFLIGLGIGLGDWKAGD